ncbi:MAG: SURF1 family protein [Hyphomicrobiaceae bacterium]|nr:SURF1 family protein [Hyphomicrobiaceae bacterium]
MPLRPTSRSLFWPSILALAGFGFLIALGTWQLERRAWKEAILNRIKTQQSGPPVDGTAIWPSLPCATNSTTDRRDACEYQPVKLRGVFDHARERHIFTAAPKAPGVPSGSPGGYWIFTPMKLETGRTAFVNRGFVTEGQKSAETRQAAQGSGMVEVVGLYRAAQARATFDGANDTLRNVWYVRNPAELWSSDPEPLAEKTAYLDMTAPPPTGGWPFPLAGKVELSNRHLEYALTWYGLAVTLLAVYGAFAWGRLRHPTMSG